MLNGDDPPPLLHGHYPASSLLRGSPPLSGASVLSASRLEPLAVLTSSKPLSTLHRRFTYVRLSQSCLPESCPDFSATFTTMAFDHSSLRWLEITPDCRPRRTYLHLSYSYASPCGPALLVTQGPWQKQRPITAAAAY